MAEKRIKIPIDNAPLIEMNAQLKEASFLYQKLKKENQDLAKAVKSGATEQGKSLTESNEKLKELEEELKALYKSQKDIAKSQPFEEMAKSSQTVRQELNVIRRDMQRMVLSGEDNTEEFRQMGERVGELRGALSDSEMVFRQFEATGTSATLGISTGFSNVGRSLRSLDFKNAENGLKSINQAMAALDINSLSKNILSFAKAAGGTLVKSLKVLGNTLISLGKKLLANPLFLLVAAAVAIIVVLVKLADHFGILGVIIDAVSMPLKMLMKLLGQLTDYIGLTNHAEQELADNRVRRAEEESRRIQEESQLLQNEHSRRINLIEAKGNLTEEEIQQIFELKRESLESEAEKQRALMATASAQYKALATKKRLTEEEKDELESLRVAWVEYGEAIKDVENNIISEGIKHATRYTNARKQEAEKQAEIDRNAWEKRKVEIAKQRQEEARIRGEAEKFISKIREQLRLDSIEDEDKKALEKTLIKLEKEKIEILKNTKLTEEEKIEIKDYYRALEEQAENDYRKKVNEAELNTITKFEDEKLKFHLESLKSQSSQSLDAMLKYREAMHDDEVGALTEEFEELKSEYERQGIDTVELTDFYLDKRNELTKQYNKELDEIRKEDIEKQKKDEQEKWEDRNKIIEDAFKNQTDLYSNLLAKTAGDVVTGMGNINAILDDEALTIGEKVVGIISNVTGMISSILASSQELNKAKLDEQIQDLESTNNIETQLINEKLERGLISEEEANEQKFALDMAKYRAEESAKKKAFESDKKLQIAQASIAMLQGIVSAFSGAMSLGPIAGPIVGAVLAGVVGTMGAINIAKIKKQKYQSGTPPSSGAPKISSVSIPTDDNDVALHKNKTGIDGKNKQEKAKEIAPQQTEIKVSISEINEVNSKITKYEKATEL